MSATINHNSQQSVTDQVFASALTLLGRWEQQSASFEIPSDLAHRAPVHQLLDQVFRRLGEIDWIIVELCQHRRTGRQLKAVLRLAIGQILFRQNLPPPVVVDTFVRLVRQRFSRREAGFVNAVLRRLNRELDIWSNISESRLPLPARLNLGEELVKQWKSHLTPAQIENLARIVQTSPSMTVRIRGKGRDKEAVSSRFAEILRPLPRFEWAPVHQFFECLKPNELLATPEFKQGMFYIQDPATASAATLLQPLPGEILADLCAAPGGKSLLLHEQLAGTGFLLSCDRDQQRLERLRDNLGKADNCAILLADAAQAPLKKAQFDGILLDVPCSNTGVIRRRPDVRWRFSRTIFQRLLKLQAAIMTGAASNIVPGGRMVYSTCSIEPEENRQQVDRFLRRFPEFYLQQERLLWPSRSHDGAYAALLRKRREPEA